LGSDYSTVITTSPTVSFNGSTLGGVSACSLTWSTAALASSGSDTDCTLSTDRNSNFGTVALEGGASPTAGLTFTPSSTGNYFVCAHISVDGTSSAIHDFALFDATDSRVIARIAGSIDAGGSQYSATMCGPDVFSNLSSRTIRIQGASSSGTVSAVQRSIGGTLYAPTIYWTFVKLN